MILQLCGSGRTSDNIFGVVTDTTEHPDLINSLQGIIRSWSDGECNNDMAPLYPTERHKHLGREPRTPANHAWVTGRRLKFPNARPDCPIAVVASGDDCGSSASKVRRRNRHLGLRHKR
jgi:hypothetical protein